MFSIYKYQHFNVNTFKRPFFSIHKSFSKREEKLSKSNKNCKTCRKTYFKFLID